MARRISLVLAVAGLVLALAAPVFAQGPKRGGVLRIAEREAPNLDPHLVLGFLTHSWANMVYSQLVRYPHGPEQKHPADFSIVPDLAEKWEYKSPTVIEFTLRKGVRFHNKPPVNGREVTAEDAKYSLERFRAKSPLRVRFDVVQSIDVVNRYLLRITLKEPSAPFMIHLAQATYLAIVPREVEEKFKDFNRPEAMIGSGPFMLKSYQKGSQIAFERNPDYYVKGVPYLDGVVIEITPESNARLSLFRAGRVHLPHLAGYLAPEEAKSVKKTNPEVVMTPVIALGTAHIFFRTDQPPFNDVRVRRAISLAIDRKAWNDSIHYGEGCIDSGPVSCAMQEWKLPVAQMDPAKAKYLIGYDPVEAKRLLAEAGYPKGFSVPMHHWPGYTPPWRTYFDLAADDLAKIGVTVEFKPEEYGKYMSTTILGKYDGMAMGPQLPGNDIDDWLYGPFYPEQPQNRSHVADAELNKLLIAQRRELDPKKRLAIIHEIQRYLADKAYYVYLPFWPWYVTHAPQVKGLKFHEGFSLGHRLMFTWLDK